MSPRLLADAVVVFHLLFIAFAVAGGALVLRWPLAALVHLPAAAWAAYTEFSGTICPLTPLENALRQAGGVRAYDASFIEHYLLPLIYPAAVQGAPGRTLQFALGIALLAINTMAYAVAWRRHRRRRLTANARGRQ